MSLQKFSVFHETPAENLQAWHRPYAEVFRNQGPVLDVGCGPGYFADVLRECQTECLGLDIDPAMVDLARSRGHVARLGNHRLEGCEAGQFGGVHISHVVEHLWGSDLELLLRRSVEILRPGGVLIIRTPNWENRYVREYLFWGDHTHTRPYPRELLVRMLRDLGMEEWQSGAEPFGMNDTFVIAIKPPRENSKETPVTFPQMPRSPKGGFKHWLRLRLLLFLGLEFSKGQ